MRLKNDPKAKEAILNSKLCIHNPETLKGAWKLSFSERKPIFIEIGCGKGQFLYEMSVLHPEIYFLGIEQYETVLYKAIKRHGDNIPENLRFFCERAERLDDFFSPGEIDRIYLNFSDPWPKKRHAKRRLTSTVFLNIYYSLLPPGGLVAFKTDNTNLFDFSLEQINLHSGFQLDFFTYDLYSDSDMLVGNVATEYENKFHNLGNPIHKLIAHRI